MVPERITQLLTAYVDGELSGRQRKAVSRMLRKSPEARKLYHKIKGDSLILRRLPRKKPSFSLTDTVMGNIKATNLQIPIRPEAMGLPPGPPPLPGKTIPAWVVFAVAAAVLLIVGFGSYFYFARGVEIGHDILVEPRSTNPTAPVACPACGDRTPEDEPKDVFTYPNQKVPSFRSAAARVPLVLSMRNSNHPSFLDEVQEELQKDRAFRCDLFCRDTGRAIDHFKRQLARQGIDLKTDPSLPSRLAREPGLSVAVFTEGLLATELADTLKRLGQAEPDTADCFVRLAITRLAPWRGSPTGADLHQPLEDMTLDQVLQAPPPPESVEEAAGERIAVAVPYTQGQTTPSAEIRALLDRYPSRRAGTLQVLMVLWGSAAN